MPPRRDGDYWFDEAAADRVVEFFARALVHVKGPWAGRPLKLEPWQADEWIRPLFGWKRGHSIAHRRGERCDPLLCEYGRRRYQAANIILPRKNAKTTVCAGILLVGLCADDEIGGENYCMAGDLDQASDLIFAIAAAMVDKSRVLRRRIQVWRSTNRIVDPRTDSFLQAIPGDWEGALGFSPHVAVMDEHLVQANTKLENAITSGMGARRQPLFIRASTAPKSIDTPTGRLIARIREIKAGLRAAPDDELNLLYEADPKADWRKVKIWKAVNPGYGTSLQPSFVDGQVRKAIDQPTERAEILQYGLNLIPDALESWMPLEQWDACGQLIDLEGLRGRDCIVAVSIRSATDLAAVAILFPPATDDEPLRVINEFHLPDALLRAKTTQDDAPPYQEWVERGAVHLVEGSVLDFAALEAVVLTKYGGRFNVREVTCNPRGAMQFIQDLQNEDANVIELVPTYKTMSPALTELERLVGTGPSALVHDGNPVLRWMWTKCRVRKGTNDEIRPDRDRSLGNIEGVFALASALNRAIVSEPEEDAGWAVS